MTFLSFFFFFVLLLWCTIHPHTHLHTLTHTLTYTHTNTLTHSHTHPLSLSHTHTHTHRYIHMVARWFRCLHCRFTARRSWVRFPYGALLALGGRSSRECTVRRWAISRAFLCGVCMFSPCSQGVSSTKNPNSTNMQY